MKLYHRTTAASAESILRDGFKDGTGHYLTGQLHSVVWLSNPRPRTTSWTIARDSDSET